MNNLLKNIGIWLVIGLVVLTVVKQFDARQTSKDTVSYSEFMDSAKNGKVESAVIEGRTIKWSGTDKKRFVTTTPGDIWMVSDLLKYGVKVDAGNLELLEDFRHVDERRSKRISVAHGWFPSLCSLLVPEDPGRTELAGCAHHTLTRRYNFHSASLRRPP